MTDSAQISRLASTADSVDDAGAPIRPPPLAAITRARADDPALRVLQQRLRHGAHSVSIQSSSAWHALSSMVGSILLFLFSAVIVGVLVEHLLGQRAVGLACPLTVVVVFLVIRWLRTLEVHDAAGHVARSIVAEGLCGQCLYELVSTTTQTSGLSKCPECGAAWLAERWRVQTLTLARRNASGSNTAPPSPSDRDAFLRWCLTHRRPERTIADDRGNFTYAPRSWLDDFPDPPKSDAERAELAALSCEIRAIAKMRRNKVIAMIALVALLALSLAAWMILGDRSLAIDDLVFPLLFLIFVAAVIVAINGSELGIPPREVALCLASNGRCGACAHSLHDAPIEGGLRVCPKCEAAWYCNIPTDS